MNDAPVLRGLERGRHFIFTKLPHCQCAEGLICPVCINAVEDIREKAHQRHMLVFKTTTTTKKYYFKFKLPSIKFDYFNT